MGKQKRRKEAWVNKRDGKGEARVNKLKEWRGMCKQMQGREAKKCKPM